MKTTTMADHHSSFGNSHSLLGITLTGISFLYAKFTASDMAAVFTCILAITNMIIAWPKLKARLSEIYNKIFRKKRTNE